MKWTLKWFICNIVLMLCTSMVQPQWKTDTTPKCHLFEKERNSEWIITNLFQSRCLCYVSHIFKRLFYNWLSSSSCTQFWLNHPFTNFVRVMYFNRKGVYNYPQSRRKIGVCVRVASDRPLISDYFSTKKRWDCTYMTSILSILHI